MRTVALIVAAGRGERMGAADPKQFLAVAGRPLVAHCLDRFVAAGGIDEIVIALPSPRDLDTHITPHGPWPVPVRAVQGGDTRQKSVGAALEAAVGADMVVVHDGARPLVTVEAIREVMRRAASTGAAIVASICTDTIKEVDNGQVVRTLERERLVRTQTPQAFRADWLREAHRAAVRDRFAGTDDAALVERLRHPVAVVLGEPANIKVTTPGDLLLVEGLLRAARPPGTGS
ncbi:MAG: 2-C-methyl-D-erythritol 4-phosphate cytidylyltransferase [Acidobacteriota bacterium]